MRRWPAAVALLAVGAVYTAVSDELTLGPRLLSPFAVGPLVLVLMGTHAGGRHLLARRGALALVALVTVVVAASALLPILSSPGGGPPPRSSSGTPPSYGR